MTSRKVSSFVAGFDAMEEMEEMEEMEDDLPVGMIRGENGTAEYSAASVGDPRVALFFGLVRGMEASRMQSLIQNCLDHQPADPAAQATMVADLLVMAFQTRDCRGGKGERSLFYTFFRALHEQYPETCLALVPLISEYGYHKDYCSLLEYILALPERASAPLTALRERVVHVIAAQLKADGAKMSDKEASLSLCAKYAPREGKHFAKKHRELFHALIAAVYPDQPYIAAKVAYRKLIASLTQQLQVTETKMCGKRYAEIDFAKVPSVCAKKYRKAFLNEHLKKAMTAADFETGNRHSQDEDRILCRSHLKEKIMDGKVKGKQLYPHEIVRKMMKNSWSRPSKKVATTSDLELQMLEVQWADLRSSIVDKLAAAKVAASGSTASGSTASAIDLGKLVPLVDVSGSMSGEPMEVAIALGILISELNHPAFRDRLITFESEPRWVSFKEDDALRTKVATAQAAPWGGSTNIEKAFELIEKVVLAKRLPMAEVPDLIIFSDMQFDEAAEGDSSTQLQRIQKRFHDLGMKICGQPYPAPRIVFWNLRADTVGFPAQSDHANVQMLSGYSPALFKFLIDCEAEADMEVEDVEEEAEDGQVIVTTKKRKINPYSTLRKVLDDPRYDAIREVLTRSDEKDLCEYSFEKKEEEEAGKKAGKCR